MNILPRHGEAVIPIEKFTGYALNPGKQPHKALAFELALGYNESNAEKLIDNIKVNIGRFPAKNKGLGKYGVQYEVILQLVGENGRTADVLTGWLDDISNGEMRLTTVHVD